MVNKKELIKIGEEIRALIEVKQKELNLTFVEDTHTYHIKTLEGEMTTKFPSVSTVIKQFYDEFPDLEKSLQMSENDIHEQDKLLKKWRAEADYANSKGSRVHYLLEMDLLAQYGSYKEVRKPFFECDETQIKDGNAMIDAGHKFINLMHRRGAILLDTEIVLGSNELKYTGQPDKVWLMFNKKGEIGFVITDWKTNKAKNFEVHHYTDPMLHPFKEYMDTALAHYRIQLPLYGRLILNMLKGTKYEDLKMFGCVIVHLTAEGNFKELRVPAKFINTVMTMPPLPRIDEVLQKKKDDILAEERRVEELINPTPPVIKTGEWWEDH
mgnify:CR=1 FL=1|tara:strand:+ start:33041 stop:34015 length:975 start_codon:yes stop_codon:yes gene_type:complete